MLPSARTIEAGPIWIRMGISWICQDELRNEKPDAVPSPERPKPQATRTRRENPLLNFRTSFGLLANPALDGGLEIIEGESGFGFCDGRFIATELVYIRQRLAAAGEERIAARLISFNTETAVLNPDERDELAAIIFDKKDPALTDLELGRISHPHRSAVDRAAEHAHGISGAGVALDRLVDLEGHESHDAMVRAFADPLRLEASHFAVENHLRPADQLIELRRNDGGRVGDETERKEDGINEEADGFFHFSGTGNF